MQPGISWSEEKFFFKAQYLALIYHGGTILLVSEKCLPAFIFPFNFFAQNNVNGLLSHAPFWNNFIHANKHHFFTSRLKFYDMKTAKQAGNCWFVVKANADTHNNWSGRLLFNEKTINYLMMNNQNSRNSQIICSWQGAEINCSILRIFCGE